MRRKNRYEVVRFNVISFTKGLGVKFPGKKCYVTLEWPLIVTQSVVSSLYYSFACVNANN